jgi:hypothetical protein
LSQIIFSLSTKFTVVFKTTFPTTSPEIKEAFEKFFAEYKLLGKDSAVRSLLSHYDFDSLEAKQFLEWVTLDKQLNDLLEAVRMIRDQKERIWINDLRPALLEAKQVVTFANKKNPMANNAFGFYTKNVTPKKPLSDKALENRAKRLASQLNANQEAKAVAKKSTAAISVTVNDVTKSTETVIG